jgi:hypothetical protein
MGRGGDNIIATSFYLCLPPSIFIFFIFTFIFLPPPPPSSSNVCVNWPGLGWGPDEWEWIGHRPTGDDDGKWGGGEEASKLADAPAAKGSCENNGEGKWWGGPPLLCCEVGKGVNLGMRMDARQISKIIMDLDWIGLMDGWIWISSEWREWGDIAENGWEWG